MKKLLIIAMILAVAFSFAGCGDSSSKTDDTGTKKEVKKEAKKEDKADAENFGDGSMFISTNTGTSTYGRVPIIYIDEYTQTSTLHIYPEGFDGSMLSFIYVDGVEKSRESLYEISTSINLEGDALTIGKHKFEIIQYADDNPEGKVVTRKTAEYEVKSYRDAQ